MLLIWSRTGDADVHAVLVEILSALKRSSIVPREAADKKTRFWTVHKTQSEEYDQELYAKYSGSMDNSTIFVSRLLDLASFPIQSNISHLGWPFPLRRRDIC